MFPCRLIKTSPYHSSCYISTSFNNLTKEGTSQFITESKCCFVGFWFFVCFFFVFFFFFNMVASTKSTCSPSKQCAGQQPSSAAALDWTHWHTQLSVPLQHAMWCLFKGLSTAGCSALQHKYCAQLRCTQVQILHSPQWENISLTKANMKPNEPFGFQKTDPQVTHTIHAN